MLAALLPLLASASVLAAPPPAFVSIERVLSPPVDAKGRPWRVELVPADAGAKERIEPVAAADAGRDGEWRHAKFPATGLVRLRVLTQDGDVWYVSPEPFEPGLAEPGGQLALGMTLVRGVARVGKQPLPGFVTFTDGSGARVGLVVNADGDFAGALPRAGGWTVRSRSARVGFDRTMEVEVADPERTHDGQIRPPLVDVYFPDHAIRGEVVDEKGEPVERFTLAISQAGVSTERLEEYEGSTFRYDRIATGLRYFLRVMAPWKGSQTYGVEVPQDGDPEFLKVLLAKQRPFRGHVVSTNGRPVAGGSGYLATVPGAGLDRSWLFTPRGARADFGTSITTRSGFACLVVFPPGHAAHVSSREEAPDDHEVVVTPEGGTLVLTAPIEPLRVPVVFRNGCPLRPERLAGPTGAIGIDRGAILEVVSRLVEAGPWSFCLVTRGQLESYMGGDPEFPLCVRGILSAGERLDLSLVGFEPAPLP